MKTISRYIMTLALLLTAVTGAWADGDTKYTVTFKANGNTKTVENVTLPHTFMSVNNQGNGELDLIINDLYNQSEGWCVETPTVSGNSNVTAGLDDSYNQYITISAPFEGNATVSASHFYDNPISSFTYTLEISIPGYIDGPAVTLNDPKTEASFDMPTSDVNVNYELVRDITQKVDVETRIDGVATERIRIAKDNEGHYKFVTKQEYGWQFAAVDKLDNNKNLTNGELTYTLKMKVGDEYVAKNFDTELCPGTWRLEATANAEKPYEGTAYGKDIELFEGYEVVVPAGEYATFYKDENLYTQDEDGELYTIETVSDNLATLSIKRDIVPANVAMLVYNNSASEKTILLIPTTDSPESFMSYDNFIGTLIATTIAASDASTDNYAFNGKQFVRVKDAIGVGANRAWLSIPKTTGNQQFIKIRRSIEGGEGTTGIDASLVNSEDMNSEWYDLNGRRLQGKPSLKGVYIKNGKKVVVK